MPKDPPKRRSLEGKVLQDPSLRNRVVPDKRKAHEEKVLDEEMYWEDAIMKRQQDAIDQHLLSRPIDWEDK